MKKSTIIRASALSVAALMAATSLVGCGGNSSSSDSGSKSDGAKKGSVYYLNFKPEQDKDWQALAASTQKKQALRLLLKLLPRVHTNQPLQLQWIRTTLLHSSR